MIMKYTLLLFFLSVITLDIFSQQINISGVIKGSEGEKLPGVNIVEKGTQNGTVSDLEGNFSLSLSTLEPVLVISYVGYITQEIEIKDRYELDIVLNEEMINLDEVVVIGYGTAKKSDLTGSVSSVKPKDLNTAGISNATQMLQGRIPGLYINSHNQNPGAYPEFILRGSSSFQGSEAGQPLIVIDGFPMDNFSQSVGTMKDVTTTRISYLNTINPGDIKQIDILKDASATAIYGSRGANGVIIITTKQGDKQGIQVDYSAKLYTQKKARSMQIMDGQQFARFYYDLAHDPDLQIGNWGPDNGYPHPFESWDTLSNTDWQKEVLNLNNISQEHNLSLSGAKEGVKYRAAVNYYNGNGIMSPSAYKRLNALARLDYQYKRFSFNLDFNYTNEYRNLVQNSYEMALGFSPSTGVYDENDDLSVHGFELNSSWHYNPLLPSVAEEKFSESNTTRISGGMEYKITEGLRVSVKGGITQNGFESFYQRFKPYYESDRETEASISTNGNRQIYSDVFLHYTRQLNDHKISIMSGGSYQHYRNRGHWNSAIDFPYLNVGYYNINAGLLEREMSSNWYQKSVLSGLGRINYDYQEKYLVTINYRLDGATVFGEDHKWGHFPSFGLAYRIDQEDYFSDRISSLTIMKIRAGYGIAGNSNIPGFRTQSLIEFVPVYVGGEVTNGIAWSGTEYEPTFVSYIANPELRWENTYTLNLGLEVGNPKFYAELNYYVTNHDDLILDRQVPRELGFTNITINKGAMVNKGIEAKLDLFLNFFNYRLQWKPGVWMAYNHNEITDLDNDVILDFDIWGDMIQYGYAGIKQKEYPLNAIWGYDFIGVWQEDESEEAAVYNATPGDPKFADINGVGENGEIIPGPDGMITEEDKIFLGDANPRFTAGFSNRISYKNFELTVFFEGVFDKAVVNFTKAAYTFPSYKYGINKTTLALNRWTSSNPTNDVPSLTKPLTTEMVLSDWTIEDGSFIRLRDITLSYKFDMKNISAISHMRVFTSASNLFTITNYTGINPDVMAVDDNYSLIPFTRMFSVGVNVSF
jgi:TonB-linked SusC/RagA family outer membrane protein